MPTQTQDSNSTSCVSGRQLGLLLLLNLWSFSRRRCVSPIYFHFFTYKTSWFNLFFFIYVQVSESHCNFIRLLQSCLLIITILIFVDSVKKKDCSFYCSCFLCFCVFFFCFRCRSKKESPPSWSSGSQLQWQRRNGLILPTNIILVFFKSLHFMKRVR